MPPNPASVDAPVSVLDNLRWQQLESRLPGASFVYGVTTTGVVCSPGCPSRLPRRENVRFYEDIRGALQAGFRPCKRCRPLDKVGTDLGELLARVCRNLEGYVVSGADAAIADVASDTGMAEATLLRHFRSVTGLTPKEYLAAIRQCRLYPALAKQGSVLQAATEAGYGSASHFYQDAPRLTGMPPAKHRKGGKGEQLTFALASTELGELAVAASSQGVCWIALGEDPGVLLDEFQDHFRHATLLPPNDAFNQQIAAVCQLVQHPEQPVTLPLDIRGTVFQRQVWQALQAIPVGMTLDYQQLAERIGRPTAARAVARACASNVLAVAVPCHRIIRRDGGLSGYRWGVERKAWLLAREKAAPEGN
ncbi:MAG: bifunctional DNA-binding transcriptional regulator/O6-methylguanine-DNA methyltransferase Ada [Pseudomonadota bacterium]|nr:bifunctional DNA-binding transcriptional regulator/O6-methylguanine-DNA methyltransferase Ada [Pseudomonadota bacterium]